MTSEILVLSIPPEDLEKIANCLKQFLRNVAHREGHEWSIRVWYPNVANLHLKSNTPPEGFCVYYSLITGYREEKNQTLIRKIHARNLVPVEIIRECQIATFYAFDREIYDTPNLYELIVLSSEE